MTLVPIVIIVLVLALVIFYVTRPLFTIQDDDANQSADSGAGRIRAEYKAVLERINELDFEFKLGKLTRDEYDNQREDFLAQATSLRRQLNAEDSVHSSPES